MPCDFDIGQVDAADHTGIVLPGHSLDQHHHHAHPCHACNKTRLRVLGLFSFLRMTSDPHGRMRSECLTPSFHMLLTASQHPTTFKSLLSLVHCSSWCYHYCAFLAFRGSVHNTHGKASDKKILLDKSTTPGTVRESVCRRPRPALCPSDLSTPIRRNLQAACRKENPPKYPMRSLALTSAQRKIYLSVIYFTHC